MAEPRPVALMLLLQVLAVLLLAGWWVERGAAARLVSLATILVREGVTTVPPDGCMAQVAWLIEHRMQRLTGMVGLCLVALVIGSGEGVQRRRTSPLGGFLLTAWTCGMLGLGLLPGVVVGILVAPWPMQAVWVAGSLAVCVLVVALLLTSGRPYVP